MHKFEHSKHKNASNDTRASWQLSPITQHAPKLIFTIQNRPSFTVTSSHFTRASLRSAKKDLGLLSILFPSMSTKNDAALS